MNRIFTLGLAAVGTALLSQPVYAEWHGGGGGGAHFSAPAVNFAPAPHFTTHAIAPQHFATHSQFTTRSAPVAQARSTTSFTPSVAFGGHAVNNGGDPRSIRIPAAASRGWDRGRVYAWNHHHYRWYNGAWVLFDDGYYGDPFDYPYGYYNNDYDQEPAPAVMYDSSQSIATSVQDQLARQGYNPGPVDGVVGPQTRDAITDFQYAHKLPVTGTIDGPLLRALGL